MPPDLERYSKQILFAGLGEERQRKLLASRVFLCGCGALGSVLADTLVRAGVGFVRIVDRDFVETSNLQRQVLFDETDVAQHLPKAVAAAEKLAKINSGVRIEPIVADVDHTNVLSFCEGADLILDGTDNFEVRFLLNDAALETGIPWIYAGVIGSHGQTMVVFPGRTACLRCLFDRVPDPGTTETCDTAGVLGPAVNVVASLEAVDALKILSGQRDQVAPCLTVIDVWEGTFRRMNVGDLRAPTARPASGASGFGSPAGKPRDRRSSAGETPCRSLSAAEDQPGVRGPGAAAGRSRGREPQPVSAALVLRNPDYEVTVFRDGRAIIQGTDNLGIARGLYARYVGT